MQIDVDKVYHQLYNTFYRNNAGCFCALKKESVNDPLSYAYR